MVSLDAGTASMFLGDRPGAVHDRRHGGLAQEVDDGLHPSVGAFQDQPGQVVVQHARFCGGKEQGDNVAGLFGKRCHARTWSRVSEP